MNKKASINSQILSKNTCTLSLGVMIIFLLCGGVAGCLFAVSAHYSANFISFQNDIVSVIKNGADTYSFWNTYLNLTKYPIIVFFLSFTVFGYAVIPIIVSLKSFFLTFSISTILQLYGTKSFLLSVSIFGIQTFISIPVLLLMATLGVEISKSFSAFLKNRKGNMVKKDKTIVKYVIVFMILLFILLLFTFLDITITPIIVSLLLK